MSKQTKKIKVNTVDPAEDPIVKELEKNLAKRNIKEKPTSVTYSDLFRIYKHNKNTSEVNKDILDIFPDLELAKEILVSSIISPNDLLTINFNIKFEDLNLPSDVRLLVTDILRNHIKKEYEFTKKIPKIIEEALFTKGSYGEIIIPDSFISANKKSIGIGFENIEHVMDTMAKTSIDIIGYKALVKEGRNALLEVSDNPALLLAEEAYEEALELEIESKLTGVALGFEEVNITSGALRREEEPITMLNDYGNNHGMPLVKKIDTNSIIPITSKNDPSKHFGYFVLLDESGNQITSAFDTELTDYHKDNKSMIDDILGRAKKLVKDKVSRAPTLENIDQLREELVIEKLKSVIQDSKLGRVAKLSLEDRSELIDILLNRILTGKKTKLLFVPENLLSYYAFDYRENGTGKSLLERITVLASFRAIIVFVSLLSFIKSSIPITEVNAKLDDDDVDYEKTMEKIMTEVLKNRQVNLPIGILKVDDLVDWVHKIGFSFNFKHPGLPDVDIDINEKTFDVNPVNDDLKEQVDKHITLTLGLTPEMIDNAYSPDFATTVRNNNVLFAKRVSKYQEIFNDQASRNIRKQCTVDGLLKRKLMDVILKSISSIRKQLTKTAYKEEISVLKHLSDTELAEHVYRQILKSMRVNLPKPESQDNDNLKETFEAYVDSLDSILETMFNSEVIPDELLGEFSDKVENIKNVIKVILIKKWISENGYMEDIASLFSLTDDGKPALNILEEYESYIEVLEKVVMPFLKSMKKKEKKIEKKLEKIENEEDEEEPITEGNGETELGNDEEPEETNTIEEPEI